MFVAYNPTADSEWLTNEGIKGKLVNTLRLLSAEEQLQGKTVFIPDGCEEMGFLEGEYQIASILHFIADMLE